jgi:hypothetical protein
MDVKVFYQVSAWVDWLAALWIAIMALIIWKVAQGRDWARLIVLVLTLLGILSSVQFLVVAGEFVRRPVLGAFIVVQTGLRLVAMWWLFTNPGDAWFMRAKA